MTSKQGSMLELDNIGKAVNKEVKPQQEKKLGRPKLNPHADDKRLTIRLPAEVHKKLKHAAFHSGKPMTEIAVDGLIKELKKYEAKYGTL